MLDLRKHDLQNVLKIEPDERMLHAGIYRVDVYFTNGLRASILREMFCDEVLFEMAILDKNGFRMDVLGECNDEPWRFKNSDDIEKGLLLVDGYLP